MTVDFMRLKQCLAQAKAEPGSDITQRDINPYLMKNAILPFLNGEIVRIGSLDFTAFSSGDILEANREADSLSHNANQVSQVAGFFEKSPASARKTKSFF